MFIKFITVFSEIVSDLWLWALAGFLVAALIEEFVPQDKLLAIFKKDSIFSILKAAFAGFFVSSCSCGIIPIVATLRKRG